MRFFWLIMFCLPIQLWAHGDEDHTDKDHADEANSTAVAAVSSAGNRAYASSELFELVLVAPAAGSQDKQITIYLDYFADNSPVADAVIEIDATAFSGTAKMVRPGLYQLKVSDLSAAHHAVALTIEAGDELDLLSTELDLTPVGNEVLHDHSWTEYSTQLLLALGALVMILMLWRLASYRQREQM